MKNNNTSIKRATKLPRNVCDCGECNCTHEHNHDLQGNSHTASGHLDTCDCGCDCTISTSKASSCDCSCDCEDGEDCDEGDAKHNHLGLHKACGCDNKSDNSHGEDCDCKNNAPCKLSKKEKSVQHFEGGCSCSRCESVTDYTKKSYDFAFFYKLFSIAGAIVLSVLGLTLDAPSLAFFIPAYLLVGGEYLIKAIKNILRGKIFDENFLMTVATVGAFLIGEYIEGVAVMLLYAVGEMFQDFAVDKSKKSISELLNLKPKFSTRIDGSTLVQVETDSLKIGDTVVINLGEKVPTDGILDGDGIFDYSALNGEFKPKSLHAGEEVLAGVINAGGSVTLRVVKEFKDTSAAKIIELVENSASQKPKTEKLISKFAKYYTPIVCFVALIIAFVPPMFSADLAEYVKKALTFLVISCPCALVISIPLSFFAGIGGASKRGVLIKGGNYLEALNKIDVVVFDKTGTLTKGVFEVSKINAVGMSNDDLLRLCALSEQKSNHPIAISIKKAYTKSLDIDVISDYVEIAGKGLSLKIDGEKIFCGKAEFLEENGISVERPADNGTVIHLSKGDKYVGNIVIDDTIKDEAEKTVFALKKLGKKILMLSGDNEKSVSAVAKKLGIDDFKFGLLPSDKADIVTSLISEGKNVAFVGDGLNDAPVLKLSTVGICMSGLGNDASVEASDIILVNSSPRDLLYAFKTAKKTKSIVVQNIVFSLSVKLIIMILSLVLAPSIWLAILADVGVSLLAILNSVRAIKVQ